MSEHSKVNKRRVLAKEKELKNVTKCLRQRLAWCNKEGNSYDSALEQYSVYPRALATCNGQPQSGSKAKWSEKLRQRYPIITGPPSNFTPDAVFMDFIFYMHTTPQRGQTITDYTDMLMRRHILPKFSDRAQEVHVIFDKTCTDGFNPKVFEHLKRSQNTQTHKHIECRPLSQTPQPWQEHINCRECKQSIVQAVGLALVQRGGCTLTGTDQRLIISGCFSDSSAPDSAWEVHGGSLVPQPLPIYTSNATEADSRMWRHVFKTTSKQILIHSPDTDVLNIRIAHAQTLSDKIIVIQTSMAHHKETKFIYLNALWQSLDNDPDMAAIPQDQRAASLQTLFICSGCDYLSYFSGHGKISFLNTFFNNAAFIGLLTTHHKEDGFLSFLRLVGAMYFKKHLAAFLTLHDAETPRQLFQATPGGGEEKHYSWLSLIRRVVSERILSEEERLPSTSALKRHRDRTCWIGKFWRNSILHDVHEDQALPEESGWLKTADGYDFDWDSSMVQEQAINTVEFLTKGCSCKKSRCSSRQCSCRREERECGPACKCRPCTNTSRSYEDVMTIQSEIIIGSSADDDSADGDSVGDESADENSVGDDSADGDSADDDSTDEIEHIYSRDEGSYMMSTEDPPPLHAVTPLHDM